MKQRRTAFSLIELIVVMAVLVLLAGLILPTVIRGKELGRRASCLSSLRQLNIALNLYTEESEDFYPMRSPDRSWIDELQTYGISAADLICPSDSDAAQAGAESVSPSSFGLSGFGDPNLQRVEDESWPAFIDGPQRGRTAVSAIAHPVDTVLFGETIGGALYVDLKRDPGNFLEVLELARHPSKTGAETGLGRKQGGSNHAFADGSAHFVDSGKALCPINLWGITDFYRTNYALCLF